MEPKSWIRQKTTWAGIAAIVAAIAGFATGTVELATSLELFFTALIGIFLRQGVAKIDKKGGS